MATSRLLLYNAALSYCGQRGLASLTVVEEPRYLLDAVWNNNAIRFCLAQGLWNWACRTVQLDYTSDFATQFGYRRAFEKPSDWVVTKNVATDAFFRQPLLRYQDEAGFIYSDLDTIYLRYVSDDSAYGNNFALWPESFREYVEAYLASKIIRNLTSDETKAWQILDPKNGVLVTKLKEAKNEDAKAEPTQFPPEGAWNRARKGRGGRRGPFGDGGTTGSLIG